MFDHVTIRASDREASLRFYETVLGAAGIDRVGRTGDAPEWGDFSIAGRSSDRPTRRLHVGFGVASREYVDAFWQAGVEAGYRDDGAPGERPQYTAGYYGGFLLDPDGNSAEAVHHPGVRTDGNVDHLWIRVADVRAAKRFYVAIAPHARIKLGTDTADRVSFPPDRPDSAGGTFSVVAGEPTERLHMAFRGSGDAAVDAFHAAATAAGHRDNGAPGLRTEYHAGYYGAFVLDPDGTNVEVVHHRR